jgi:hypothetical protein
MKLRYIYTIVIIILTQIDCKAQLKVKDFIQIPLLVVLEESYSIDSLMRKRGYEVETRSDIESTSDSYKMQKKRDEQVFNYGSAYNVDENNLLTLFVFTDDYEYFSEMRTELKLKFDVKEKIFEYNGMKGELFQDSLGAFFAGRNNNDFCVIKFIDISNLKEIYSQTRN